KLFIGVMRRSSGHGLRSASVANIGHQLLDFGFQFSCKRQEWKARWAAIVTVQVRGVFQSGDTEFRTDSGGSACNTFLLNAGEFPVAFFPGGKDFVAGSWSWRGKGKNCADGPGFEGWKQ